MTLRVEVCFALPAQQWQLPVELPDGATVLDAISASGILDHAPVPADWKDQLGIFAQRCGLSDPVANGDRVEIYRPLELDPMAARRERAATQLRRNHAKA